MPKNHSPCIFPTQRWGFQEKSLAKSAKLGFGRLYSRFTVDFPSPLMVWFCPHGWVAIASHWNIGTGHWLNPSFFLDNSGRWGNFNCWTTSPTSLSLSGNPIFWVSIVLVVRFFQFLGNPILFWGIPIFWTPTWYVLFRWNAAWPRGGIGRSARSSQKTTGGWCRGCVHHWSGLRKERCFFLWEKHI